MLLKIWNDKYKTYSYYGGVSRIHTIKGVPLFRREGGMLCAWFLGQNKKYFDVSLDDLDVLDLSKNACPAIIDEVWLTLEDSSFERMWAEIVQISFTDGRPDWYVCVSRVLAKLYESEVYLQVTRSPWPTTFTDLDKTF